MEIRLNKDEMVRVSERIGAITNALKNATEGTINGLSEIEKNIQSEDITTVLSSYTEKSKTVSNDTISALNAVKEWLDNKLAEYATTENKAQEYLNEAATAFGNIGGSNV